MFYVIIIICELVDSENDPSFYHGLFECTILYFYNIISQRLSHIQTYVV